MGSEAEESHTTSNSPVKSRLASSSSHPTELTPRSKVKALLAQFDDSDNDNGSDKDKDKYKDKDNGIGNHESSLIKPTINPQNTSRSNCSASPSSGSDTDEPVVQRPVGRMAARMMSKKTPSPYSKSRPLDSQSAKATPTRQLSTSLPNSSPALFISPTKVNLSTQSQSSDSESSGFSVITSNIKLKELLARKRGEKRGEQRAAKEKKRQREAERLEKITSDAADLERVLTSESNLDNDVQIRENLTKQSRPTRKAGKKALEEMNRETQRIAREQNLAHQVNVKKTYRTADFLKRFNANRSSSPVAEEELGTLASSDAEHLKSNDTPPTSPIIADEHEFQPPPPLSTLEKDPLTGLLVHQFINDGKTADIPKSVQLPNVQSSHLVVHSVELEKAEIIPAKTIKNHNPKKKVRVLIPPPKNVVYDSDDDLEISDDKIAAKQVFESIPTSRSRENFSYRTLRSLANLTSPGRKKSKSRSSMTMNELKVDLQVKAREQALRDREARINDARARGVYIPTVEERERDYAELISIEKAREQAILLAKSERNEAEKNGEVLEDDDLPESEDDYDFEGSASDGSNEDDEEKEGEKDDDEYETGDSSADELNPFLDGEADESADDYENSEAELESTVQPNSLKSKTQFVSYKPSSQVQDDTLGMPVPRKSRNRKVIDDDDEDNEESANSTLKHVALPSTAPKESAQETALAFDFGQGAGDMSLSQAFAGTLQDPDSQESQSESQQLSLSHLREILPGSLPEFENAFKVEKIIQDSQSHHLHETQPEPFSRIDFGLSQFPSQSIERSSSKLVDMPQLTQDIGFAAPREPAGRFEAHSTIETVPLQETPQPRRRSRLRRKTSIIAVLSDSDNEFLDSNAEETDSVPVKDAYDLLFKNAKKAKQTEVFNKKNSAAKGLVEEQAEESEDEYQGLGGVSDDDSDDERDEEVAKMIDSSYVKVDERAIAAFHAENERKDDEKNLERLYKDITTGGLRKRRGGDLDDLDDSDDEHMERQRRKQAEFARMRKALLDDEKIGKIAQNPKQQAFFHAIEDLEDDTGADWLFQEENVQVYETQGSQENDPLGMTFSEQTTLKRKRCDVVITSSGKENVAPGASAVLSEFKKPKLSDIREQLSFLVEDSVIPATQEQLSEDEIDDLEIIPQLFRSDTSASTSSNVSRPSVVNRLIRTSTAEDETSLPLAFQTVGSTTSQGFKVPSLLRRATTLSTTSDSSHTAGTSQSSNEKSIKTGGSRKNNIHYQAHEAERRSKVDAADKNRTAQLRKTVMATKSRAIIGMFRGNNHGFD